MFTAKPQEMWFDVIIIDFLVEENPPKGAAEGNGHPSFN
jgi:hypothetical protein